MKHLRSLSPILFSCTLILMVLGCSERSTNAPETLSVSGTIKDEVTSQPVIAAKVTAIDAEKGSPLAETITDQSGFFEMKNLPRRKLNLLVEASGYSPMNQTAFDPNQPDIQPEKLTITMSSEPCCSGVFTLTVTDRNNTVIAGATVKLWKRGTLLETAQTNASGQVVFDSLCRGEYGIDIIKDGYNHRELGFAINELCEPVSKTAILESSPCCTGVFNLTVKDNNGNAIAGATVKIWKAGAIIKTETTNGSGQISVGNLCGGEYGVDVSKDGYTHRELHFAINTNCDPVTKDVVLEQSPCCTGTFTLTVKDKNGNAVSGATVKIWKAGVLIKTETTNGSGQISVGSLCVGEYGVDVTKDGYTHREFGFAVNTNCDPVTKDVVLEQSPCCTGTFTLTVKDKNGNAVSGATVKIWKAGVLIKTETTNGSGQISVGSLCGGEYGVDVTKEGYAHREFHFAINTNCDPVTKDVVLEQSPCCTGTFALTVKDKNGNAISGATVKIWKAGVLIKTETTNGSGQISVGSLCGGEYGADVTKDGYTHREFGFAVNTNCDPVTKDVVLEQSPCCTGVLSLIVKDVNGNRISGATVKIWKNHSLFKTETTNGNGELTVSSLCGGEYAVDVIKDGFNHREFAFTINASCDPVSKEITLEPGPCCTGQLTVYVKKVDGSAIAGATVKIWKGGALLKTESTDVDGKVVITSLCKSMYGISASKDGFRHREAEAEINANCDAVTKTLTLEP